MAERAFRPGHKTCSGLGFLDRRRGGITAEACVLLSRWLGLQKSAFDGLALSMHSGSVGGAVCMNAGPTGRNENVVLKRSIWTPKAGRILKGEEHTFSYRPLFFTMVRNWLQSRFRLVPGEQKNRTPMAELAVRRRASRVGSSSAGSTFKRRWAISGRRDRPVWAEGTQRRGAQVSEKHAACVNRGAQPAPMSRLMEIIVKTVLRETGILLEPEIKSCKPRCTPSYFGGGHGDGTGLHHFGLSGAVKVKRIVSGRYDF